MQRNSSSLNTKTITVSNENNQEEEDGLHIERVLQDLVDGMLMESKDSTSYVLLLPKIVNRNSGFDIDYLNTMKMPSETVKTSTTLVA